MIKNNEILFVEFWRNNVIPNYYSLSPELLSMAQEMIDPVYEKDYQHLQNLYFQLLHAYQEYQLQLQKEQGENLYFTNNNKQVSDMIDREDFITKK